ncbi:MAG: hypothetical protein RDU14_03935 [Melioribacteraceae bacterium]|nr:hypothetical protein [Melioribacteraceae bacterium]
MTKLRFTLRSILLFFLFMPLTASCQVNDKENSFYVASWNVENLFDTFDDPYINDSEFLPESSKEWTEDKFQNKLSNLAKVINYINDGCGPDILGLVEIENVNVLKWLVYKFRDRDYVIVHRDSPDERGIDAALVYDRKIFGIVAIDTIRVEIPTRTPTRYILHATLRHLTSNSIIHYFVNHWPSRRGGEVKSEPNRIAAAKTLRREIDKIQLDEKDPQIIIMGDFNDDPDNKSVEQVLGAKKFECNDQFSNNEILNLSYKKFSAGEGSYLYGAKWNMIDQMMISASLLQGNEIQYDCESYEVIKPEFIIIQEGDLKGAPLRTYAGSRYLGGYSDHFPVGARFIYSEK